MDDSDDDIVCDQPCATPQRSTTHWRRRSPSDIQVSTVKERQQCQALPADGAAGHKNHKNPWAEMLEEGEANVEDAWHAARFERCVLDAELKSPIRVCCSDVLGDSKGGSFKDRVPSNDVVVAL